jgi:hypothetical protein
MRHTCIAVFTALSFFLILTVSAQQVVAPAGHFHENTHGSVCWTLGETIIHAFAGSQYQITQGFQQGIVSVSTYAGNLLPGIEITAYPNPTRDLVIISIQKPTDNQLVYELFGINGNVLKRDILEIPETKIGFDHLLPGTYFIRIIQDIHLIKTFKIIKQ